MNDTNDTNTAADINDDMASVAARFGLTVDEVRAAVDAAIAARKAKLGALEARVTALETAIEGVRAILSQLGADTAAALVGLLVQWLRGVLGAAPGDRHAVEVETDRAMERAEELGAVGHATALVAALVGHAPDGAAAAYCDGDTAMAALLREALATLAGFDAPPSAPLAGQLGARVLRGAIGARARAVRAMMDAAVQGDDGAAALAALHMHRDEGTCPLHTLTVTLGTVAEGARLVAANATAVRDGVNITRGDAHARGLAANALEFIAAPVAALNASVDVLRALASNGGPS